MPTKQTSKYVFFYRRDSILSNHYPASFVINGVSFVSVEQYYFYCKLLICGDSLMAEAVLREPDPAKNKKQVYASHARDNDEWGQRKLGIMRRGVYEKFRQNPRLLAFLLSTEGKEIVEASPNRFWGIGVDIFDQDLEMDNLWLGLNHLGKILMEVRTVFLGK
ncbi:NADAR family protein [Vibrio crassostreae]|uniref:NADAR family protein n=1 Tax=Vibrio crassostreae TaxID=246167 RepID=UPI001B30E70E